MKGTRLPDAVMLETWKLAVLGIGITGAISVAVFAANLLTSH